MIIVGVCFYLPASPFAKFGELAKHSIKDTETTLEKEEQLLGIVGAMKGIHKQLWVDKKKLSRK